MSKDPILSVISKYRLPVKRNNQSIKEFLASYYKEYIKSIEDAIDTGNKEQRILQDTFYSNLTEKIPLIRENCADIIETLELYDGCDILLLNKHFGEMMEKIKGYLKISSLGLNYRKYKRFYRIRQGDSEYNRIDLFHIQCLNEI